MDFAIVELKKQGLELFPGKARIIRSSTAVIFLGEKLPGV